MPPVPTKPKLKQKVGRRDAEEFGFDGGHAREIEQKRNSGQISCAECRRLKIKCDKQIPCQSCQRRGCAALCPNGSLATGQGTRFVLAATEHLHRRIARMGERIRQLEDALGELHSQHSTEQHPLLRPDLVGANRRDEEGGPLLADDAVLMSNPPELLEAFGTLSVAEDGETPRFFGPTAGSHCLLMTDDVSAQDEGSVTDSARGSKSPELPHDLGLFSQAFPFNPGTSGLTVRKIIQTYLPRQETAEYLVKTYLEQAGWLFQSVTPEQLKDEILPEYYHESIPTDDKPHQLALLFLVFAIGALVDLNQAPGNAEAERFHHVARAAICLRSVIEKPSFETIQALHLLSIYNALSGNELAGQETSMETTWSLVSLAAHLSHTLGLHRDSARWDLPPKEVERRRVLFWDLFVADSWNSLDAGRPPIFNQAYVNCKFPQNPTENDKDETDKQRLYESWTARFARECVAEVSARTLTTDSPSYSTIMELDRKVREFPIPELVEDFVAAASGTLLSNAQDRDIGVAGSLGRFVMSNAREVILLYIHRSYFSQAIIENPGNPLNSSYTPSFLAAYRASTTILHTFKAQFDVHGSLIARFWPIWTYVFSSAMVFGTIVMRGPRSPMATTAMKELRDACTLFSKGAKYSRRAQKALPIANKLSEKAHNALILAQSEIMPYELGQQRTIKEKDEDADALAIFEGRTKFVSMKRQTDSSPEGSTKQTSPAPEPQQQQRPADQTMSHSYSSDSSGAAWTRSEQTQVMPSWDSPYSYATSQSAPVVPLPLMQHSVAQIRPQGSSWLANTSDPYQSTNLPGLSTHLHPQVYHPQMQHFDQPPSVPPLVSSTVPASYYEPGSIHAHHHQNSLPSLHQYHDPAQQLPPIALAPPELAQLGLVAQESRLDQQWTSFMRQSGCFEDFRYKP